MGLLYSKLFRHIHESRLLVNFCGTWKTWNLARRQCKALPGACFSCLHDWPLGLSHEGDVTAPLVITKHVHCQHRLMFQ